MKTFLRGALLAAAVCLAVLALPGGEAQARDECGALSSGTVTCSDQAYASGIRYDVAPGGWVNGVAGDVGLTVTGGSSTMITIPTTTTNGFGSGIVVRTAHQPGTTGSRTITLQAGTGTGSPAVVIAQGTSTLTGGFDSSGVVIHQRGKAADATTVTLGSNVAIGTATAPMTKFGITVLTETAEDLTDADPANHVVNTGAQTVTTAATIHSTEFGIIMDNRGRGNTAVTNTGSITTATTGGNLGLKDGIHILDWSHNFGRDETNPGDGDGEAGKFGGDARTTTTTTTVTNSGAITVGADNASGIRVIAEGLGLYRVVHTGTGTNKITASGAGGRGISVDARWHRGTADTDAVKIESSGDITADRAGSVGIFVWTQTGVAATRYTDANGNTEQVFYPSSANIEVVTTGGTITGGTGGSARGIHVVSDMVGATPAEIRNAATIKSEAYGIVMDARGSGNITVANSGAVTVTGTVANGAGIRVVDWLHNPGHMTEPVYGGADRTADTLTKVTNSGAVAASAAGTHGIHVDAFGLGRYEFVHGGAGEDGTVAGSIAVSGAGAHGIFIDADYNTAAAATNAIKVTSSGTIRATGANGRGLWIRNRAIDGLMVGEGDDAVADASLGGRIEVTNSGAVTAKAYAIAVETGSPGAIDIENSGVLTVDGANSHIANVRDDIWLPDTVGSGVSVIDSGAGAVDIASSANIAASGFGIVARKTGTAGGNIAIGHSAGNIVAGGQMGILAAIGENEAIDHTGDISVDVTGGRVQASESRLRAAVEASTFGTGSIAVNIGKDATLASRHGSGVYAFIDDVPGNTEGRIAFDQAGKIEAPSGVHAIVARNSGAAETRAAARQPVIDISWTGTYKTAAGSGRFKTSGFNEAFRVNRGLRAAEFWDIDVHERGISAEVMSWRKAAWRVGIADQPDIADGDAATAILDSMATAAEGATQEAQAANRANYALKTAILPEIRKALASEHYTIAGVDTTDIETDGTDGLSDAELVTWLKTRDDRATIMTEALQFSFTDEEAAVFQALVDGNDPTAALDALQTARGGAGNLPDDYRRDVMEIAGYYNVGDIRVAVNGGSIDASGDGVRVGYVWPNNRNGRIDLTVAEDVSVIGGAAGVHLAGAGMGEIAADSTWGRELYLRENTRLRQQFVTVNGTVTGGTDAAVHLAGGGALLVGAKGKVLAGSSGRAVLVNDPGPARIAVNGLIRGGSGAEAAMDLTGGGTVTVSRTGKVEANGAELAIRGASGTSTRVTVHIDNDIAAGEGVHQGNARQLLAERVEGGIVAPGPAAEGGVEFTGSPDADGTPSRYRETVGTKPDGTIDISPLRPAPKKPPLEGNVDDGNGDDGTNGDMTRPPPPPPTLPCDDLRKAGNNECGLYEALPSALLAMNTLPSRDDRLSAARDANGGWALVEGSSSEWKAAGATQPDVAYDISRYGMRGGVELAAGEQLRLGVSAHHLRSNAKMDSAGEIEMSGAGMGVNASFSDDGFYADAQAAVTWFDAELALSNSHMDEPSKWDTEGVGYAMGLEAGKRVDMSDILSVTPRAGLSWSDASLDAFSLDSVGRRLVEVEEAQALTGRVGVRVDAAPADIDDVRLFGALDVSHLLSQGAEAQVVDKAMKTTSEETGVRAGVGASWSGGEGFSLRGAAHYAASGGDNSGFGGSLSVAMRF